MQEEPLSIIEVEEIRRYFQEIVDSPETRQLKVVAGKARKKLRQVMCILFNGSHELYSAHSDSRLFQRCLCGYETKGWSIDRRDRRLRLVKQ